MKESTDSIQTNEIKRYTSSGGVKIYCIPIESFPAHYTNVYLVLAGDLVTLIDLGSGWGESNSRLSKGIEEIKQRFNEKVTLKDIDLLLITHGHVDHFGSLSYFRSRSNARVGIHELDAKQITSFEEVTKIVAKDLRLFLRTVGISEVTQSALMEIFFLRKEFLISEPLDFYLREEAEPIEGIFQIYHTPGHCPGAVCIQVGDVLFTGDHLLSKITSFQPPEFIEKYTGLKNYLDSLKKIKSITSINKAFGGHHGVIHDPYSRIEAIEKFHGNRLEKILRFCSRPRRIKDISTNLFNIVEGYKLLPVLEQVGAYVEYLLKQDRLTIENLRGLVEGNGSVIYFRSE